MNQESNQGKKKERDSLLDALEREIADIKNEERNSK